MSDEACAQIAEEERHSRAAQEAAEREAALLALNEQLISVAEAAEAAARDMDAQAQQQRQLDAELDAEVRERASLSLGGLLPICVCACSGWMVWLHTGACMLGTLCCALVWSGYGA